MTNFETRYEGVIAAIDLKNSEDPRRDTVNGVEHPTELLYSQRMTEALMSVYPDASESLRIAARAQHICRWRIPRTDYPATKEGYHTWRRACQELHATLTSGIMAAHGYEEEKTGKVCKLLRKQDLKTDRDSQRLENVVCMVFVKYYLADFAEKHDDKKLIGIIQKSARKMDAEGMEAISALNLPEPQASLVSRALAK